MVMLSEIFSPDSTGRTNTRSDRKAIIMLQKKTRKQSEEVPRNCLCCSHLQICPQPFFAETINTAVIYIYIYIYITQKLELYFALRAKILSFSSHYVHRIGTFSESLLFYIFQIFLGRKGHNAHLGTRTFRTKYVGRRSSVIAYTM